MGARVHLKRIRVKNGGVAGLAKIHGEGVKVGILEGTGEHNNADNGQTVSQIAAWNEFGTDMIPERPFLRGTVAKYNDEYKDTLRKVVQEVLNARDPASHAAIDRLALKVVADVKNTITELKDPPNADATIAAKGSDNPLIDTGQLRQSITWGRAAR